MRTKLFSLQWDELDDSYSKMKNCDTSPSLTQIFASSVNLAYNKRDKIRPIAIFFNVNFYVAISSIRGFRFAWNFFRPRIILSWILVIKELDFDFNEHSSRLSKVSVSCEGLKK